jgi:hypothetical protein
MLDRIEWTEKKHEYALNIAGKVIPISVINANLKVVLICVSLALCFVIGEKVSTDMQKIAMQQCAGTKKTIDYNPYAIVGMENFSINQMNTSYNNTTN